MSDITLIKAQIAAAELVPLRTDDYESVVLHANGLAGVEEVDILIGGGATPVVYSEGGTAVKLTASQPNATLPVGPIYLISKDATVSACSVIASVAALHGN